VQELTSRKVVHIWETRAVGTLLLRAPFTHSPHTDAARGGCLNGDF
jgi:hypothetical protein